MTAEVAIVNRTGIAIAADSAVTVQGKRVWKSSDKIFPLTPQNDIAIMISGSGEFNKYPWETVISSFYESHAQTRFDHLEDCASAFVKYLTHEQWQDGQHESLLLFFNFIKTIEEISSSTRYNGVMDFRKSVVRQVDLRWAALRESSIVINRTQLKRFSAVFFDQIKKFAEEIFEEKITKAIAGKLVRLCWESFRRSGFQSGLETGVVFCGFGKKENFPVVIEYFVDGRFGPHVKAWEDDRHDVNEHPSSSSAILPFAQRDMAQIFMEGISFDNMIFLMAGLSKLLDRKTDEIISAYVPSASQVVETAIQRKQDGSILDSFMEEFMKFRDESIVQPILDVVGALPKDEMAAMAEALVEITSLRRKVDSNFESVGGPVDVAFISKADGFVWLSRKQYFDIQRNPDYDRRRQDRAGR